MIYFFSAVHILLQDEEIVEITVEGDDNPEILKPSTDDLTTNPTLPGDVRKAVIYELGPQVTIPRSIKNILRKFAARESVNVS